MRLTNRLWQFEELIAMQRKKVLACAERIIPHITEDDLLKELEMNPYFRYEEGILEGLMTAEMAVWAGGGSSSLL